MYVCVCNRVTDNEIRRAVQVGHDSLESLCSELRVGSCCGRCKDCALRLIHTTVSDQATMPEAGVA